MHREQIESSLKAFLERRFPNDAVTLRSDTNLLEDWFVDSLGIVETVMFIETEFDLQLARADINGANFRDLAALSSFVAQRLAR